MKSSSDLLSFFGFHNDQLFCFMFSIFFSIHNFFSGHPSPPREFVVVLLIGFLYLCDLDDSVLLENYGDLLVAPDEGAQEVLEGRQGPSLHSTRSNLTQRPIQIDSLPLNTRQVPRSTPQGRTLTSVLYK